MSELTGKNVLITGAASGIGKMMAQQIAAQGGNLVLLDIDQGGLVNLREELQRRGSAAWEFVCDLTDRQAIYDTAKAVVQTCGHIDILINNAGIVSGKPLLEISDAAIERTFQVNTLALFWMVRAFLPGMAARNSGHLVTIASAGGLVGTARLTDYCASKFAAVGFDDSLRLELKRLGLAIKTTVVCPFFIDTGMFAGVKTRFAWLLPILSPDYAVRRIIQAIRTDKARLIMPRFVYAVYLIRLLPVPAFDFLAGFFGINRSMDEFVGRTQVASPPFKEMKVAK